MRYWMVAAGALLMLSTVGAAQVRRQTASPEEIAAAEAAVERFVSPTLTRFGSEEEFRAYVEAIEQLASVRRRWAESGRIRIAQVQQPGAQSDSGEGLCNPEDEECPDAAGQAQEGGYIVITGSRINPRNASITNNQMRNVEEGDIVKQIDDYLLILQDGRIFVAHIAGGRGRSLVLTDRMNVYLRADERARWDTWYDEMLVFGDRVLVTGYSYGADATELSVFRLGPEGRLSREGVFYLSSDDYYSSSNYATRLIGDSLVIYSLYDISGVLRPGKWPIIRRWRSAEERGADDPGGRSLFDAANIYRPLRPLENPSLHAVSVCPLGSTEPHAELECRTVAVAGEEWAHWYVTESDVFLWGWDDRYADEDCPTGRVFAHDDMTSSLLYRVSIDDGGVAVRGVRGVPFDQFSMQSNDGRFRAFLHRTQVICREDYYAAARVGYFDIPLELFGRTLEEVPADRYTVLPDVDSRWVVNRFTETHLVYGGLNRYRSGFPQIDWSDYADDPEYAAIRRRQLQWGPAYVVPLDRPQAPRRFDIGHTVVRAERVGNDFVLTGYRDRGGLHLTMIDADGPPRIASSIRLNGRYESEGRSHAFNSLIEPDGGGMMALPTSPRREDSERWWWRSRASDMSFIAFDPDGSLGRLGELDSSVVYDSRRDDSGIEGYTCEVSCVDWYGNSRPIFTDRRIFALSGVELIEGRVENGRIREVQRLNIAVPDAPR